VYEKCGKRCLDLLFALVALPFFVLLLLVVGPLIKLEDGGPVFYVAKRIGKDGRSFSMFKFRSMKVGAPLWLNADGSTYNAEDDPRVTRIGRFLRETSLDEVPQLLNVIKGDMSIVGPRPSLASALDTYREDEVDKLKVRPGITGYVQAFYRNEMPNREKRLLDAWYANNVSFALDLRIMLQTVRTVIFRKGLYTNTSRFTNRGDRVVR